MTEAAIVSTARTPIGKAFRGAFNLTHGADDGGARHRARGRAAKLAPEEVEDVILGCGFPEGAAGHNLGRQAAIRAGLPVTTAGMTINRFCSSGMQAISMAAQRIIVDGASAVAAGGVESISLVAEQHQQAPLLRGLDQGEQAGALLADDRHGRNRRQALQHQPRGAGRVRAGKPTPHGSRAAGRRASRTRSSRSRRPSR